MRCRFLLVCGVLAAVGFGSMFWRLAFAQERTGRKLAFLVGIEKYEHGKLNDLEFTENDVEDLDAVLKADGYKTLLLTTKLGKGDRVRRPTRENIWNSLGAFLKESRPTKTDLMIVCLAGHGIQPLGSDDSYFCPLDANPTIKEIKTSERTKNVAASPETLISVADVLKTLDDSGVGFKLLLVDACRERPERPRPEGSGPCECGGPARADRRPLKLQGRRIFFRAQVPGAGARGLLSSRD